MRAERRVLSGWGRTAPTVADVVRPHDDDEVREAVLGAPRRGVLARGLGRAYGDAAQSAGGTVLDLTAMDRVLQVDTVTGVVVVEAGASLDRLMRLLLPLGLFVPVTPGTRQVTVGGAVAADVHGKDHHRVGSFCRSVLWLDLLTADGQVRRTGPDADPDLFWATAGGMGLTGVVLRAALRMRRVETSSVVVDTERTRDLADLLDRMEEGDARYEYSVAWVDCLAPGRSLGRSVLTRGRPATRDELPRRARADPLRFDPPRPLPVRVPAPTGAMNRWTGRAANAAYYAKARDRTDEVQGIAPFFHPLDVADGWNAVYGSAGFVQYQLLVPPGEEAALERCLVRLSREALPTLAVLKRFGDGTPGPLSFPAPGWTLAVDLPVTPGTAALLDGLDEEVLAAGGRLYLAKDSRTTPDRLRRMYPRIDGWRAVRDRVDPDRRFSSDLSRRLCL